MAKMFYTSDETTEKLGVDADRLKELIDQKRLREFRDGQRIIFKVDQVDRLAAELKGGSGAGNLDTGPIDLAPGASGGPISLADSAAPGVSAGDSKMSSKSGTGFSASGKSTDGTASQGTKAGDKSTPIKVFESSEIKPVDSSAQTQISSALDESISPSGLDSVGSGSGLLDLTRESDNTSLGAELLEEIYPGDGGAGGSQSGVGSASGIFDQTAAGSKSGETGMNVAPPHDGSYTSTRSVVLHAGHRNARSIGRTVRRVRICFDSCHASGIHNGSGEPRGIRPVLCSYAGAKSHHVGGDTGSGYSFGGDRGLFWRSGIGSINFAFEAITDDGPAAQWETGTEADIQQHMMSPLH